MCELNYEVTGPDNVAL